MLLVSGMPTTINGVFRGKKMHRWLARLPHWGVGRNHIILDTHDKYVSLFVVLPGLGPARPQNRLSFICWYSACFVLWLWHGKTAQSSGHQKSKDPAATPKDWAWGCRGGAVLRKGNSGVRLRRPDTT